MTEGELYDRLRQAREELQALRREVDSGSAAAHLAEAAEHVTHAIWEWLNAE